MTEQNSTLHAHSCQIIITCPLAQGLGPSWDGMMEPDSLLMLGCFEIKPKKDWRWASFHYPSKPYCSFIFLNCQNSSFSGQVSIVSSQYKIPTQEVLFFLWRKSNQMFLLLLWKNWGNCKHSKIPVGQQLSLGSIPAELPDGGAAFRLCACSVN